VLGLPHGAPQEDLEQATAGTHNQMYEDMLARLQAAVQCTGEKMASNTMKGVARNLKFLKEVSRNGRLYEAMEEADIAQLLGHRYDDIRESRQRLYTAALDRQVKDEDYVSYHWRRFLRDEQLMRIAAGSIYGRSWAPFR
jgi:hypothetical protein